ncbi:MAG: alpha-amylase family glycosyl hydrolase [Chlamydiota bacterium]
MTTLAMPYILQLHGKEGMVRALFVILFLQGSILKAMPIDELEKNSMLYQSKQLSKKYIGSKAQWQRPYGLPKTGKLIERSSAWFTSYALSTIHPKEDTFFSFIGSEKLWDIFENIGLSGIHLGPLNLAGQFFQDQLLPSTDGGFDPISYELDPKFGTYQEYLSFVETVKEHRGIIIGDLVPGHTGRGYDFLLALKNYEDYPGLYHMVEVEEKDWKYLPDVPDNQISTNLSSKEVENLKDKGYIVGRLQRVLFYDPKAKQTNWDATRIFEGVDKKKRRWIYLHYFKDNQPSLNWLDPSFAANRVIAGDIILSTQKLYQTALRLDANAFLGLEINPDYKKAWSEEHPLSIIATDTIAMMTRKFGGFTFQELNMPLKTIKETMEFGPELSYDFLIRAASYHALATKNADFLRLCYHLLLREGLQPIQFIHALQNHDEINLELIQFSHDRQKYFFQGKEYNGFDLKKEILNDLSQKLLKNNEYTCSIESGPCTTIVGLCAASLGINDVYNMAEKEIEKVKKAHLTLAFFNAMQPGVFAISGWDLIGALPLQEQQISQFTQGGDRRWANRGGYDLLGCCCNTNELPKAPHIYSNLIKQLKDPSSFTSQIKGYLKARNQYAIDTSYLTCVPSVTNPSLFILIHRLSGLDYLQMTAINFGDKPVQETIEMDGFAYTNATNILTRKAEVKEAESKQFTVILEPLESKAIVFEPYRSF